MTVRELYRDIAASLQAAGCEDFEFDTLCLLEDIGNYKRGEVPLHFSDVVSDNVKSALYSAAKRRAAGEPLQYILGTWDFLSLTLSVGKGVLIPRPESELLCLTIVEELKEDHRTSPVNAVDLCAGTGCIGLGIASLYSPITVTACELSEKALGYLKKNIARYPSLSVNAMSCNILTDHNIYTDTIDVLVSNPPYIPHDDLPQLQREVQKEPAMALDGGQDGYDFYRAIADHWIPKVSKNGIVAVEIGIGQSKTVYNLFCKAGLTNIRIVKDYSGIDRVVIGRVVP